MPVQVPDMPDKARKIIHCDCDCFYAAVEMRDDPSLRQQPIAVGGTGSRGVVATCNYLARSYGVRSAMPVSEARRRCPDLLIVPLDMARYRRVSGEVMAIFRRFTDLVEPLSLDEAFLDVSDSEHFQGSGTLIAEEIRRQVKAEVGIIVSAGVAPNKFLAKVASDWRKPDGLFVITPPEVEAFVARLPVRKLFGVGEVTARKLADLGIETCGDLAQWTEPDLMERFGRHGHRFYQMARGIDPRPVSVSRIRKSVSVERTFPEDIHQHSECIHALRELFVDLQHRMARREPERPLHKVFVKLRFGDFTTQTQERLLLPGQVPVLETFLPLFESLFAEEGARRGIRLLGLGIRYRETDAPSTQLPLFPDL